MEKPNNNEELVFSNTKLDMYSACGYKYYLSYVEGYVRDYTKSALLFGRAVDNGINYLLTCKKNNVEPDIEEAYTLFYDEMSKWDGSNELDFYSNEVPEEYKDISDKKELEIHVWKNLIKRGRRMLETYQAEIIPLFKRVIDIQVEKKIQNGTGQTFQLIIDLIAELQDGTVVLFDNKTSSKKYPKNAVVKSQQLSLYSEFFPNTHCGYIVLLKTPTPKGELTQVLIDKIPEEQTHNAFEHLQNSMEQVLSGVFEKNEKSCYAFGKPCEFWSLCKKNNPELLKRKKGYPKK